MSMMNWTKVDELGKMRDAERLREAARERMALHARIGRSPLYPIPSKVVTALRRWIAAWEMHLQAAAS